MEETKEGHKVQKRKELIFWFGDFGFDTYPAPISLVISPALLVLPRLTGALSTFLPICMSTTGFTSSDIKAQEFESTA